MSVRPRVVAFIAVAAALATLSVAAAAERDSDLRSPSAVPLVEAPGPEPAADTPPSDGDGRVYNGVHVTPGSVTWQAEIYREISDARWAEHLRDHPGETRPKWELQHWCGGALIAENWVLTAAHCVLVDEADSDPLLQPAFAQLRSSVTVSRTRQIGLSRCVAAQLVIGMFRVRLGADDIAAGDGISFRIDCAVVHPGWNPSDMYHDDIALVHIVADGPAPVRDPKRVRVIRRHDDPVLADGTSVAVTGWGKTRPVEGREPSARLMQVDLGVEDEPTCLRELGANPSQIHPRVLCAGAPNRKTCLGDSGGPVVIVGRPTLLVGVVSWGKASCTGDAKPGVYTRVAAYTQWIDDVLNAPP